MRHKDKDNISVRIPHLGVIATGKDCYIGANSTIARGTLSDTIIGDYVKVDTLKNLSMKFFKLYMQEYNRGGYYGK